MPGQNELFQRGQNSMHFHFHVFFWVELGSVLLKGRRHDDFGVLPKAESTCKMYIYIHL